MMVGGMTIIMTIVMTAMSSRNPLRREASSCATTPRRLYPGVGMANLPHGGIVSFAVAHELDGASSEKIAGVYTTMAPFTSPVHREVRCNFKAGDVRFVDVPLSVMFNKTKLVHFVDVVKGCGEKNDVEEVTALMTQGDCVHELAR